MENKCATRVHYLGGGFCRLNVEKECAEGGGYGLHSAVSEIAAARREMEHAKSMKNYPPTRQDIERMIEAALAKRTQ